MSARVIKKKSALKGDFSVPGDKSISHRAVMFSSIARGETRINNFLHGEDCISTLNAMRLMGVDAETEGESIVVKGVGLKGLQEPSDIIDAGNSGTTIRLLTGLLAGQNFFSVITGDKYLRRRPMKRVVKPLSMMAARIWGRENGEKAPLAIQGGNLKGIEYQSPVASAQVKSSILLAALSAEGKTTVLEPALSRDHSERMLLAMGARGGCTGERGFYIEGGHELKSTGEINVPGDISSAAFFIVAALITDNSEIRIKNVGVNPTRTGIIDVLKAMDGDVEIENCHEVAGEPVADIVVKSSQLRGTRIEGDIIPRLIDEIPVLAVAAAMAEGATEIRGAEELRVKESDRIASVATELAKFGVDVAQLDDGMIIKGRDVVTGANVDSHGDHRIAMAMAIAGLKGEGETNIEGVESIEISFPGFFDILEELSN